MNEHLHHFIQRCLFGAHIDEYKSEGIALLVPPIPYFDNSECGCLLQNKPGGLIHIMDDQACRLHKKTDHSMTEAFRKRWGNHSLFKLGAMNQSGFAMFTVNHFNGPVTYSSEGFLERSLDALNLDFVALFWGTSTASTTSPSAAGADLGMGTDTIEGAGSINPFIKGLFSEKAIATQAHPKSEDMIVAVQQPVKPMRAPSTWCKGTMRWMPVGCDAATVTIVEEDQDNEDAAQHNDVGASSIDVSRAGVPCVAGKFHAVLNTLFNTLSETQMWYIFCINPNDVHLPNQLKERAVKVQVRSAGLGVVVARCGGGSTGARGRMWEVGVKIGEFWKRYCTPLSALGIPIPEEREQRDGVACARTALGLGEVDVVVGQFKVNSIVTKFAMVLIMMIHRYSCPWRHSMCWKTVYAQQTLTSRSATIYAKPKPG